ARGAGACLLPSVRGGAVVVAAAAARRMGHALDPAGRRIDLDLGEVTAVREGLRRIDRLLGVEALGNLAALVARRRLARELEQSDPAVGAGHRKTAGPEAAALVARPQHRGRRAAAPLRQ